MVLLMAENFPSSEVFPERKILLYKNDWYPSNPIFPTLSLWNAFSDNH